MLLSVLRTLLRTYLMNLTGFRMIMKPCEMIVKGRRMHK
jgi:hypothetical protein